MNTRWWRCSTRLSLLLTGPAFIRSATSAAHSDSRHSVAGTTVAARGWISAADSRTGWLPSCHSSSTMAGSAATGWRYRTGCPFSRSYGAAAVICMRTARSQLRPAMTSLLSSSSASSLHCPALPCTRMLATRTSCVAAAWLRSARVTLTGSLSGTSCSLTRSAQPRRTKQHEAPVSIRMSTHCAPSSCPRATIVLRWPPPTVSDALSSRGPLSSSWYGLTVDHCAAATLCRCCCCCCCCTLLAATSVVSARRAALLLLVLGVCDGVGEG